MNDTSNLQEFLKMHKWDTWVSLSFRWECSSEKASRVFKKFFKNLNSPEDKFFDMFFYCMVFFEKNKFRRGTHIHALFNRFSLSEKQMQKLERRWSPIGQSKIKKVHEHVIPYLTEKFQKKTLEHFDYFKINSRYRGK
ncbi:MAG: hypothetical protein P9M12_07310 [Candidatus Aceula lacicola]|nr:hypothetical protein [Candidatus Aceula lacicola]